MSALNVLSPVSVSSHWFWVAVLMATSTHQCYTSLCMS